jgi:CubicO group peptidase (beta-lactamase class C family)
MPATLSEDAAGLDRRTLLCTAAASAALTAPIAAQAQTPAPKVSNPVIGPTAQGQRIMGTGAFSTARLARMREIMAGHVAGGAMPGVVTLLSRRDDVHVDAIGAQAFGGAPMKRDAIFRIASVTKPITAVAAMILVEEAKLRLDDPVDPVLPELANRKVLRSIEGPLDDVVPANRQITLRDLLTFRLGLGAVMVFPSRYPIQKAMEQAGVAPGPTMPTFSGDELMKRYGSLPLLHQPGERWLYNSGLDILGVLIERVTGKTLEAFFRERIFTPLGMKDTAFSVPAEKLDRFTAFYVADQASGKLNVMDEVRGRFAQAPAFQSGAGGLVSTADDLLAFGRMMLNGGKLGNERIVSRLSVELMTTDQITPEQKAVSPFFPGFWDDRGWGFGLSVITRRDDLFNVPGRFGWDGGYGTSWYVDPKEQMIGILLMQRLWDPTFLGVHHDFWTAAYQAIDD